MTTRQTFQDFQLFKYKKEELYKITTLNKKYIKNFIKISIILNLLQLYQFISIFFTVFQRE